MIIEHACASSCAPCDINFCDVTRDIVNNILLCFKATLINDLRVSTQTVIIDRVPAAHFGAGALLAERPKDALSSSLEDRMQALTMFTYRPNWTEDESELSFWLNQTLVGLLDQQLQRAGLFDCQALQWLPEASRNVVTDFEVMVRFTPDVATEQAALVADGLRNEIQQLLVAHDVRASFQVNCFINVYFAAIDQDGTVRSSNDEGYQFDLVH
jgi:hypothetical protein